MGGNAWERHGLFRFGAFVAARVRRPPQYQNAKSALHCGRIKRIIQRCNNRTQERRTEARRGGRVRGLIPSDTATYDHFGLLLWRLHTLPHRHRRPRVSSKCRRIRRS
jgi:hypothetical protein